MSTPIQTVDWERYCVSVRVVMVVAAGIWLLVASAWSQDSGQKPNSGESSGG